MLVNCEMELLGTIEAKLIGVSCLFVITPITWIEIIIQLNEDPLQAINYIIIGYAIDIGLKTFRNPQLL